MNPRLPITRGPFQRTRTLLGVHYAHMLEYRAEIILWMLAGVTPFILLGLWMEAAEARDVGLTAVEFARYYVCLFVVRQLTIVWVIWDFERAVVEGKLSHRLLQPLDPGWHDVARHVSERGTRLPFVVALLAFFFWLYPEAWWIPTPTAALQGLGLCALAFILRFLIQYTMALMAFWTERASSLQELWFIAFFFLSGILAPLSLYPEALRDLAMLTPFPYVVYLPTAAFADLPALQVDLGQGLTVTLAWIAGLLALNRWLWRRGLRHYSAMGA